MGPLTGQTGVVVGASSGIGRATSLLLAEQGMHVVAAARRIDRLQTLAAESSLITPCVADMTQAEDAVRLIDAARGVTGRIELVVYAAGTNIPDRALSQLTSARWDELLRANLTGALLITQAALPTLRSQGGGLIVYISSAAVQRPDVSGVAYQASKHGLVGLAHGTRTEEREHGIRTTVIFPGLSDTEILAKRPVATPPEILAKALDPRDVAEAVLFVARLPPRALVPELPIVPAQLW